MRRTWIFLSLLVAFSASLLVADEAKLPFAPSELTTVDGERADADMFFEAADCGECHKQQYEDWLGSMHSRAHHDSIYLAFAELGRKELGDDMYRFCSGCHAPAAVASGEIPGKKRHTFLTNEGVTCDACHTAKEIRAKHAGGGANASIVLDVGETRYGPRSDPSENPVHGSAGTAVHGKSEFCSACHTLTHPHNGLVIENTYEEWKHSPYAAAGIQCQDCHMRTVEDAIKVAETMKPIRTPGKVAEDAPERPDVKRHLFVGANANGKLTGASDRHSEMARKRLQSAATIEAAEAEGKLAVTVTNVGAGHNIPTSITELRQVWIDVTVTDASGAVVLRSGAIDPETGAVDPKAAMFTATLVDKDGNVTYKPWAAEKMLRERFLKPKQPEVETYDLPAGAQRPLKARAVLRYRSAPQEVMDRLFGKGKYPIEVVDMCATEVELR